jgi:hypothetical protein
MFQLIQLVKQMREAQRKCFIKASSENIKKAQMLEKSVDKMIIELSKNG